MFLGSQENSSLFFSKNPIVKGTNFLGREALTSADVPQSLRDLRARLGFDFGKFDYAIVDGQAVAYDVNRTPTYGTLGVADFVLPNAHRLAQGLEDYL